MALAAVYVFICLYLKSKSEKWIHGYYFFMLNIFYLYLIILIGSYSNYKIKEIYSAIIISLIITFSYLAIVSLQYIFLVKAQHNKKNFRYAFWLPILLLILYKLPGLASNLHIYELNWADNLILVGISFVTFKLSYSALELENGRFPLPPYAGYISYAFYIPALFVGPINPISNQLGSKFTKSYSAPIHRLAIGLFKLIVIGTLLERLNYQSLFVQSEPSSLDYLIAPIANFLFIYYNFSGICDIVISISNIIKIPMKENFNSPLLAKNIREFWSRWHISLSDYFKDVVFSPVVSHLTKATGIKQINHNIALGILTVFILVGLWHGTGLNYLLFGLLQGMAVIFNHYTAIACKKNLGMQLLDKLNNRFLNCISIGLTFTFNCITMLLVTNSTGDFINYTRGIVLAIRLYIT